MTERDWGERLLSFNDKVWALLIAIPFFLFFMEDVSAGLVKFETIPLFMNAIIGIILIITSGIIFFDSLDETKHPQWLFIKNMADSGVGVILLFYAKSLPVSSINIDDWAVLVMSIIYLLITMILDYRIIRGYYNIK